MENSTDQYIETKTRSRSVRKIHDMVKQIKRNAKLEEQFMRGEEMLNNWIALACQISDIEEFKRQISDDESEPI